MTDQEKKEKYLNMLVYSVVVREWEIDDIDCNSFVMEPANETCFSYFDKDEKHECKNCKNNGHKIFFDIQNEEQRIVTGLVMVSGKWIPRKDADNEGNKGYIFFSRETVRKMRDIFGYNRELTIFHDEKITGDAILLESFLKENQETTEWHLTYKILTDKLWSYVKDNRVRGFSIEAWFLPKKLQEVQSDFKSIDFTNVHSITDEDMNDTYIWVLGTSDHCTECIKWAKKGEHKLSWWIANALPGIMIGTQITEDVSAGSTRFSVGQYNSYCENQCKCHLLRTKKQKIKK